MADQHDHCGAAADEARRQEERRRGRLGLPDRARSPTAPGSTSSRSAIWSGSICGAMPIRSKSRSTRCWCAARRCAAASSRALVSCDFPFGPLQEGVDSALRAAIRLVKEGGADMLKLDGCGRLPRSGAGAGARRHPGVRAIRPHAADRHEIRHPLQRAGIRRARRRRRRWPRRWSTEAKLLEDAGAALLDFTNSGPVAGAAVVKAVAIPVIGGFGGGPWLDGRVRLAHTAIGYAREMDRLQDRHLRQYRQGQPRRLHGADRRRARRPPDQGLSGRHHADRRSSTASRRATR